MLQNSALCPYLKIVLQGLIYLAPQQLLCVLRAVKLDGTELSRKYHPRNANCTVYPIILGDVRIVCRTITQVSLAPLLLMRSYIPTNS